MKTEPDEMREEERRGVSTCKSLEVRQDTKELKVVPSGWGDAKGPDCRSL